VLQPAILFLLLTVVLPGFFRNSELRLALNSESWMAAYPAQLACAPCRLASSFVQAGDPITVWGWAPELYVLTNTIPATLEPLHYWQIEASPMQDYFLHRFLQDLQRHPPRLFLDAVGPGQFAYQDRTIYGHEAFSEIRRYVNDNFYLAGDVEGVRVFARKEPAKNAVSDKAGRD